MIRKASKASAAQVPSAFQADSTAASSANAAATVLPELDPLMHQPLRTQIAAYLSGRGETTFSELKRVLGATDGNLDAHLGKLIEAGYVTAVKELAGREGAGPGGGSTSGRARTRYNLSAQGRDALAAYVGHLSRLLDLAPRQTGRHEPDATTDSDLTGSHGAAVRM